VTTRSPGCTSDGTAPPAGIPSYEAILGRAAGENFAVASRLLPRSARRHLLAFYGYARLADELGDAFPGDRTAALRWLEGEVDRALTDPHGSHPLVGPAAAAVLEVGIDPRSLYDLIEANRLDQSVHHYGTFEQLLAYCTLSANPIGRLVLGALGYRGPQLEGLSDSVCSGLQLVEHWQDVREDARAGRVYVPAEDLERFGVDSDTLAGEPPASADVRALMVFETARARRLLDRGTPLVGALSGRPRLAVAGFIAGGHAALDAIARRDFDVLVPPTRPSGPAIARRLLMTARTRTAPA
jgi:squalene synthase HpnC